MQDRGREIPVLTIPGPSTNRYGTLIVSLEWNWLERNTLEGNPIPTADDVSPALPSGPYSMGVVGIFLIMGNAPKPQTLNPKGYAGFLSSSVVQVRSPPPPPNPKP